MYVLLNEVEMLLEEMDIYKTYVSDVQEMRLKGEGILDKKEYSILYFTAVKERDGSGTEFIVRGQNNSLWTF